MATLALSAWGGMLVSAPQASGGPMNFDLSNPVGAAMLMLSMLLLPDPGNIRRWWIWASGGLLAAAPVLRHLWMFPPFGDGQAYASYIGVPDPALWPAAPGFTAFGMVPLALALAAAAPLDVRPATTRTLLLWASGPVVLLCCGFAAFNGTFWWLTDTVVVRRALLAGCLVVAAVSLRWRQCAGARVAGGCAFMLFGLCGSVAWLEAA